MTEQSPPAPKVGDLEIPILQFGSPGERQCYMAAQVIEHLKEINDCFHGLLKVLREGKVIKAGGIYDEIRGAPELSVVKPDVS